MMSSRHIHVVSRLRFSIWLALLGPLAQGAFSAGPTLPQRVAAIEDPRTQAEWKEYLARNDKCARLNRETMVRELQNNSLDRAIWPRAGTSDIPGPADNPEAWYKSDEAVRRADNIVSFQMPSGGWGKGVDMTTRPRAPGERWFASTKYAGTFDNDETWRQMRFLAQVAAVSGLPRFRDAFMRGLDFVLNAQFPNGGWPQSYPLAGDYHDHVAFRDRATVHCLELLRDIGRGEGAYRIVDEASRRKAAAAFAKGMDCILRTQQRDYGFPTGWGLQHDPLTLEPAAGRAFEPPGLATGETAGILRFLMTLDSPTSDVVQAVYGGIDWFERVKIGGVRWDTTGDDRRLVDDPQAPALWARFYEVGTNRPVFAGGDGVVRYNVAEIDKEHRNRYEWYETEGPASALREFAEWRTNHPKP